MTENKRFTVPLKYSLSHSKIQCDGEPLTNDELVRILNANDGAFLENFNLKKENEQLKSRVGYLEIENESLGDGATKYAELYHKLLKENEELKQELAIYRKLASCSNCKYQDYDWYDDGDEFEVCNKGNDVTEGICKEWEEF